MRVQGRELKSLLKALSGVDALRVLPPEEMHALVPHLESVGFSAGARMIEEGARGDALYFIVKGKAQVDHGSGEVIGHIGPGEVVGEMALLTDSARTANVNAVSDVSALRFSKSSFEEFVATSPGLRDRLETIARERREGSSREMPSPRFWAASALRSIEARYRGLTVWQLLMGAGLALWLLATINEMIPVVQLEGHEMIAAALQLLTGLLVIQGACEAFVVGVERLGARLEWDGFISGTIGSLVSTLPEFVVIGFLVLVEPVAAYVTAVVTIFNNALVFSIYSFFLPKNPKGAYAMPRSVTVAGGQILIVGAAVSLIIGIVMQVLRFEGLKTALTGGDLIFIAVVLLVIYAFYVKTLVRHFAEGQDDEESVPPDPHRLGHDTSRLGIGSMMALGIVGAYTGGEAIGAFAETALNSLKLPTIPTAAGLAFFAGISEYIIVYKSHRRGELGIALSNVFGGMTQVMFMLLPATMLLIGVMGMLTGELHYAVPINTATTLLMLLLFPLFYVLHQHLEIESSLTDLDATAMTGIYLLLLYFLFTSPA